MKRSALLVLTFAGLFIALPRCVSTPPGVTVATHAPKDTTDANGEWKARRAWIFIDGMQQGTTPATVTLRREFGVDALSLHVGSRFEEVRRYEVERIITSSRRDLDYSFRGGFSNGTLTFNAAELSKDKDGTYVIPFYEVPIQIVDNDYDLLLIVKQ